MEGKEYNVKLQRLDVLMDKLKITKREIIEMRLLASELEKYEDKHFPIVQDSNKWYKIKREISLIWAGKIKRS